MTKYNKKLLTTLEDRFDKLQAYLDRVFQFEEGEDLYAFIASIMYNKDVDECREVNPDGSANPEGKEMRNRAKQFILPVVVECDGILDETDEDYILPQIPQLSRCPDCGYPLEKYCPNCSKGVGKDQYTR